MASVNTISVETNSKFDDLYSKILLLTTNFETTKIQIETNTTTIQKLNDSNDNLNEENNYLKTQISSLKSEINEIQQYLRVNNLEVVGLPEPDDENSDEDNLLRTFNLLSDGVQYYKLTLIFLMLSRPEGSMVSV